jgi:hypothetical protein
METVTVNPYLRLPLAGMLVPGHSKIPARLADVHVLLVSTVRFLEQVVASVVEPVAVIVVTLHAGSDGAAKLSRQHHSVHVLGPFASPRTARGAPLGVERATFLMRVPLDRVQRIEVLVVHESDLSLG